MDNIYTFNFSVARYPRCRGCDRRKEWVTSLFPCLKMVGLCCWPAFKIPTLIHVIYTVVRDYSPYGLWEIGPMHITHHLSSRSSQSKHSLIASAVSFAREKGELKIWWHRTERARASRFCRRCSTMQEAIFRTICRVFTHDDYRWDEATVDSLLQYATDVALRVIAVYQL